MDIEKPTFSESFFLAYDIDKDKTSTLILNPKIKIYKERKIYRERKIKNND